MKRILKWVTIGIMGQFGLLNAADELPSREEMWVIIQQQQKQIERLNDLVESNLAATHQAESVTETIRQKVAKTRSELQVTQAQLEATTLAVETNLTGTPSSASTGWWNRTSVGGYGEVHANFYENAKDKIDFHRFVLFVNHDYNDWISLFSELELEHSLAGEGKPGEVELEQAFVRMDWTRRFSTETGLFIIPVGILNETHEPATFYGVERNNVEKRIIPTTWWEAGIKATYRFDNGLALEGAITSGLDNSSAVIRSGRQKVADALFEEKAINGRLKYTGIPGLELAASFFYQEDLAQSDDSIDYSGLLTSLHAIYSTGGFALRALYANWSLDGDIAPASEDQWGFYLEPSYRWDLNNGYGAVGIYGRWSEYEYFNGTIISENMIYELGINYWPTDNVVFKLDLQSVDEADELISKGDKIWNLGFGYHF